MATANLLQTSVSGGVQNALSLQGDGVFFPKASTTSRLALTLTTTDKGFIVYDTTDNNIYFWNGAAWESIPGSGDAGANGSVQYNDNGIVSGASNFVYDKVTGLVSLASATISGDLTVATDRLKVVTGSTAIQTGATTQLQVGTTSWPSTVIGKSGSRSLFGNTGEVAIWNEAAPAIGNYSTLFVTAKTGAGATTMGGLQIRAGIENASNSDGFVSLWTTNSAAGGFVERYKIDSTGVATWSNVGGVAGTAMTLNSTGLGVGVTPSAWGAAFKVVQLRSGSLMADSGGSTLYNVQNVYFDGSGWVRVNATASSRYEQSLGAHSWWTGSSGAAGGTPTFTPAMTLDASGNLLVGVTSASNQERLNVSSAISLYVARVFNTASSGGNYGIAIRYSNAAPNNGSNEFLACSDSTASRAFIYSNGGLANYQANNVNLSDIRTKTDIKPLTSYWNKIKALEIVTFKYNDQTHSDDNIGLIAQQVEAVAPELVDADGFGETPVDGVPLKTIYTTDLYHASIKALQEAMSRIEALEAKLA